MASLQDLKNKLQQMREAVEQRLPDVATTLTISAKALAERRIRDKGFGVKYSTNKIPVWFLEGKELNKSGTAFIEKKKAENKKQKLKVGKAKKKKPGALDPFPGSDIKNAISGDQKGPESNWGEFRGAQGLQNSHVDLGYTNKMWANMGPVEVVQGADNIVRANLGATNVEAQKKMNWNRERYGDFIGKALTEEDRTLLTDVVAQEINNVLEQFKI